MPQALAFDGTATALGGARLPNVYFWPQVGAFEFYIQTSTNGENQALFSTVTESIRFDVLASIQGLLIYLDANGNIVVYSGYWNGPPFPSNNHTTSTYSSNITWNDNEWHQVSIFAREGVAPTVWIDGKSSALTLTTQAPGSTGAPHEPSPHPSLQGGSGLAQTAFGVDTFNVVPIAGPFKGNMTEIRLWNGGPIGLTLYQSFSLNYGIPIDVKTQSYIQYYWPLWSTLSTPLTDAVQGAALIRSSGFTVVDGLPPLYDDLSDVLANTKPSAFDLFTNDPTGTAFSYIMKNISMGSDTPTTFRANYVDESMALNFSVQYSNIKALTYPTAPVQFTSGDFQYVQETLLHELNAVTLAWSYYNSAVENIPFVQQQFSNAASYVYTTVSACSIWSQVNRTNQVVQGVDDAIELISAAASFGPEGSEILMLALKGMWSALSWGITGSNPQNPINSNLQIQVAAGTLNEAGNDILVGMKGKMMISISRILSDAGYLSAINARIANGQTFSFAIDLDPSKNSDLNNLDSVYNGAIIFMTHALLVAGCTYYYAPNNQYGGCGIDNLQSDGSIFSAVNPPWQWVTTPDEAPLYFGGKYLIGTTNGQAQGDPYDVFTALPMAVSDMINKAAQFLGLPNISTPEVFWNWGITQVGVPVPDSAVQKGK